MDYIITDMLVLPTQMFRSTMSKMVLMHRGLSDHCTCPPFQDCHHDNALRLSASL